MVKRVKREFARFAFRVAKRVIDWTQPRTELKCKECTERIPYWGNRRQQAEIAFEHFVDWHAGPTSAESYRLAQILRAKANANLGRKVPTDD